MKKLLKNSFLFGVIPKLPRFLGILMLPLLTPFLTEDDFGVYGIIESYVSLACSLVFLGLHVVITNSFFTYGSKFIFVWRKILGLVTAVCLFSALLFACIFNEIFKDMNNKIVLIILSVMPIIFYSIRIVSDNFYVLKENPKPLVFRNCIFGFISILINYYCIVILKVGFWGWIISLASVSLLTYISFGYKLFIKERIFPVFSIKKKRLYSYLLIALPVIPHNAAHYILSSSDRIVMEKLNVPIGDIGFYSLSYRMGEYVSIAILALFTALGPTIQRYYRSRNKDSYNKLLLIVQVIVTLIVSIFSIWINDIFKLLIYNDSLLTTWKLSIVIIFSWSCFPLYVFVTSPLMIEEKTSYLFWISFVPALINILLNILLIPIFGYKSAVLTTLFSYFLMPMMFHFIYKIRHIVKEISPNFSMFSFCVIIINLLLLFFIYFFVCEMLFINKIIISLMLVLVSMLILLKNRLYDL